MNTYKIVRVITTAGQIHENPATITKGKTYTAARDYLARLAKIAEGRPRFDSVSLGANTLWVSTANQEPATRYEFSIMPE